MDVTHLYASRGDNLPSRVTRKGFRGIAVSARFHPGSDGNVRLPTGGNADDYQHWLPDGETALAH